MREFLEKLTQKTNYFSMNYLKKIFITKWTKKIGYKIREHSTTKIPIILAVGKKEEEYKTVSLRRLGNNETKNVLLEELTKDLRKESLSPIQ